MSTFHRDDVVVVVSGLKQNYWSRNKIVEVRDTYDETDINLKRKSCTMYTIPTDCFIKFRHQNRFADTVFFIFREESYYFIIYHFYA